MIGWVHHQDHRVQSPAVKAPISQSPLLDLAYIFVACAGVAIAVDAMLLP